MSASRIYLFSKAEMLREQNDEVWPFYTPNFVLSHLFPRGYTSIEPSTKAGPQRW